MSEVEVNGKPKFKKKGNPEVKPSKNQQQVEVEAKEFEQELKKQREELKSEQESQSDKSVERAEQELSPSHNLEQEIIDPPAKFTLTADELAKIISAAQGGDTTPHLALRTPADLKGLDKAGYVMDDALGEVGRGMHRVADGCRDIVGGAIDIVTLGRAHRK